MTPLLPAVLIAMLAVCSCNIVQEMEMDVVEDSTVESEKDEPREVGRHHHHHHHHHHHCCRAKHVAFSAYLSEDTDNITKGQIIKFDKVLLNDGQGYENTSGTFRAPVCGVYTFTFVVAQRHENEVRAKLVVDGETKVGAIAEGMHKWHDAQGTNTVNLHVHKGQSVWIEVAHGNHVEGNDKDYRYTTFSGHFLYKKCRSC